MARGFRFFEHLGIDQIELQRASAIEAPGHRFAVPRRQVM